MTPHLDRPVVYPTAEVDIEVTMKLDVLDITVLGQCMSASQAVIAHLPPDLAEVIWLCRLRRQTCGAKRSAEARGRE